MKKYTVRIDHGSYTETVDVYAADRAGAWLEAVGRCYTTLSYVAWVSEEK